MKKETIGNLKLIGVGILLAGIGIHFINKYVDDDAKKIERITDISYDTEDGKVTGVLSYKEVSESIKIVTLEDDRGNQFKELMYVYVKDTLPPTSKRYAFKYQTSYIRLKDGWEMISFDYASKEEQENKDSIRIYGEFKVLEEENFIDYLLEHVEKKENYTVEEILEVYQERVSSEAKKSQGDVKTYGKKN